MAAKTTSTTNTNTNAAENKKKAQHFKTEANKKRRAEKQAKKAKKIAAKKDERAQNRAANWAIRVNLPGYQQGTNKTPKGTKPGVKILREEIEKKEENTRARNGKQEQKQNVVAATQ